MTPDTVLVLELPLVVEVWHDVEEGVRLSIEDEFTLALADVEMGKSYCSRWVDWYVVEREPWGW
jgi:hypothetical protein